MLIHTFHWLVISVADLQAFANGVEIHILPVGGEPNCLIRQVQLAMLATSVVDSPIFSHRRPPRQ